MNSKNKNEDTKFSLSRINIPPLIARMEAAYELASEMIQSSVFGLTEEERIKHYDKVIWLLDEASASCENATKLIMKNHENFTIPMNIYLTLIQDSIKAAKSMVRHQVMLFKEEKDLNSFLGKSIVKQLRFSEEIFSKSEMNIYNSVIELIKNAGKGIQKHCNEMKKPLSKNAIDRYNKALAEFHEFYEKKKNLYS